MSAVVVRRRHSLPLPEAKHLADRTARRLHDDFGGAYGWEGNTLCFRRSGASGYVAVTAKDVEIRVDITWLLTPLQGRIEREILAFCNEHLGRQAESDRPARPSASRKGSPGPARPPRAPGSQRPTGRTRARRRP